MKLFITVKPKAKKPGVTKVDEENYLVAVTEPPVDGRANDAVIRALAEYLQLEPYQLRIAAGQKGRKKIVEIL